MNARKLFVFILGACLVCTVSMNITRGLAASPTKPEPPIERQEQQGKWSYQAFVDHTEGRIIANVAYATDTVAQIKEFATTQRSLGEELAATNEPLVDATIVFRHPLTQQRFEQFAMLYQLRVTSYTLRFVDSQGQRTTIFGSPDEGVLVPKEPLRLALKDVQERSLGAFRGWVEVQATISSEAYKLLVNDNDVYLVDVTRPVIHAAFKDDVRTQAMPVDFYQPQIFWRLEDLNIATQ